MTLLDVLSNAVSLKPQFSFVCWRILGGGVGSFPPTVTVPKGALFHCVVIITPITCCGNSSCKGE